VRAIGDEIRRSRTSNALSLQVVAKAAGISASELSRIERGLAERVSLIVLSRLCAVVGLDLSVRAFPGGSPLRDARHGRVLGRLRAHVRATLGWALEVPLPNAGDQRAWDAVIRGSGWRYGVECEMNPIDGHALLRRLALKERDGMVDGVILLMPDTRQARLFRREFAELLADQFPVRPADALRRLAAGTDPGGSAIIAP
jgi:transcriptional regulator with XRE-family HTH domain